MSVVEHAKLHHVGIVMNSQERADRFTKKFGPEKDCMEYVEPYKSNYLFTRHKEDETPTGLVIPLEGVLVTYNNGKGGMHHIASEAENVEEVKRKYEVEGMKLLEKSTVSGTGGIIVNFLRPKFGERILVESVQKLKK